MFIKKKISIGIILYFVLTIQLYANEDYYDEAKKKI